MILFKKKIVSNLKRNLKTNLKKGIFMKNEHFSSKNKITTKLTKGIESLQQIQIF